MDEVLAAFATVVLDHVSLGASDVLVDVGCGCGATTLAAAEMKTGARVAGVDISRPMLAVARARAVEADLAIEFVEADAATAQMGVGDVDWIISRFGLMFFADPEAAFRNLRSWLKPSGSLVTVVWSEVEHNPWALGLMEVARRHIDMPTPPPDGPGPFSLGDSSRLEELLRSAGFARVTQEPLAIPMRVEGDHEVALQYFKERGPIASALEETDDARVLDALFSDLRAFVVENHDGDALSLPTSARIVVAAASCS